MLPVQNARSVRSSADPETHGSLSQKAVLLQSPRKRLGEIVWPMPLNRNEAVGAA